MKTILTIITTTMVKGCIQNIQNTEISTWKIHFFSVPSLSTLGWSNSNIRCATCDATPTLSQANGNDIKTTPAPPLERELGRRKSDTIPFSVSIFNKFANSLEGLFFQKFKKKNDASVVDRVTTEKKNIK